MDGENRHGSKPHEHPKPVARLHRDQRAADDDHDVAKDDQQSKTQPEFLAKLSAGIIFLGFNLTFFPQFILGYLGMPRRYHSYPPEFQMLNVLSSAGASILGIGYLIPMAYLMWSLRYGRVAGNNPWGAVGLEWTTTSPPPTENFADTPVVTWEAYEYPARVDSHVA